MDDVLNQQTLNGPARFSGIGLHGGNRVNMTILPAPGNSGIAFRRMDLEGKPEIEARVENVIETNRSTILGKGNVKIHTVEHVLATLAGYGIDNAIVELDANEPPIADGSSREFCRVIQAAGIAPLAERREAFAPAEPIKLEAGETVMTLFPDDAYKISCTSADKLGRFTQFFSTEITPGAWETELSQARTFCFFEEIEHLIKNNLIKGGCLENAVVIRDDAVLTTEPLRYPEEFVRHKILDILGDLALLGRPIRGHVIAVKPSHAANCEFVRLLAAQMNRPLRAALAFGPPPSAPKDRDPKAALVEIMDRGGTMDAEQVMKILPHRYPFLMLDRVLKVDGNFIVGMKTVSVNEPYFQGHFPGHPVMPGVLQLEAIAQTAGVMMLRRAENAGQIAYFMAAENVKWRKPVLPGDVLMIEVEMTRLRGKLGKAKGVCKVDGEIVSEADVTFMLRSE
ncbi:MAG: bifunctional UDP-3-O-[3-hydroxymyristoyl] N-acetylglucosamine deacetylase/3-hydroxyacyl-ACP dehydratase [Verrucomicrobia bacterium]|nr:bifunctional UDP-3-O-[3-hydroxymyristoyl] N-acetylglucosamine deacetylase/3-hydroxyacyl-ACP dehydratase [Verrucomicrobiota bacterium]MDE3100186.1 bifunctional UDP-3-O-[3-hydroxymyristoyl] N-acetylglucosamine deacetylase/3-hydroxyacyl-ACP dehydratase [Verrucomicrobiota bacterium]